MTDVTMIGLGPMGLALSRALLDSGRTLSAWNRTASKGEAIGRRGATLAANVVDAVHASPITIVCVTDYATTHQLLGVAPVTTALRGKVVVQLSTGTPQDARDMQNWARQHAIDYLDGALLAVPRQIGRPDTPIFLAGDEPAWSKSESVMRALGGNLMYRGTAVGSAAAWDLATLCCMFGAMFGFFHGARICEAEDLDIAAFGAMIAEISPVIGEMIKDESVSIRQANYGNPESSLKTCAVSGDLFVRQAREANLTGEFPEFVARLFERAMHAGYGEQRLAAMMKVLRSTI